jgi:predicted O-methyltransferase YrrM
MTVRKCLYRVDPYAGVDVRPLDLWGWGSTDDIFARVIADLRPHLVLEVGAWLGASSIHMAREALKYEPHVEVVAIDTWLGEYLAWTSGGIRKYQGPDGRPQLYEQFLSNVMHAKLEPWITPFPLDSINAAYALADLKVQADLIYIDGGHEHESVRADCALYRKLLGPGGVMLLDDAHYAPVRRAADEALAGYEIEGAKILWTAPSGATT